jgi:hypothetical protein
LGANLLLRYLGEAGKNTSVVAAMAMSAGYCGKTGFYVLRKNKIYSRVLAKKWLQVIKDNAEVYKNTDIKIEELESKVKTLEDLDRLFSIKILKDQYPQVEFVAPDGIPERAQRSDFLWFFFFPQLSLQRLLQCSFQLTVPGSS